MICPYKIDEARIKCEGQCAIKGGSYSVQGIAKHATQGTVENLVENRKNGWFLADSDREQRFASTGWLCRLRDSSS